MTDNNIKIGFYGTPNSGKSTLYNSIAGIDFGIISEKPQTTQRVINNNFKIGNITFTLYDTPGINLSRKSMLCTSLNTISLEQSQITNCNFIVIPCNKLFIHEQFLNMTNVIGIIITKIDMMKQGEIPIIINKINDLYEPKEIFCCSGKYGIGVDKIINYIASLDKRNNSLTPMEELKLNVTKHYNQKITCLDTPCLESLCKDFMVEAIFNTFREEIPYNIVGQLIYFNKTQKSIHLTYNLQCHRKQHYGIIHNSKAILSLKKHITQKLKIIYNNILIFITIN